MGVNRLWELLAPAATRRSLPQMLLKDGLEKGPDKIYRLGVDASIWIHQCEQLFLRRHAQRGENPELRTLFYRLARLHSLAVLVVFVFDGPDRPSVKRGTKVVKKDHWITGGLKQFIAAFGFKSHVAPGEAEAELGLMCQVGLLDAVLTDDSDALIFGATTVIRNPRIKFDRDDVAVYTKASILQNISVSLTPSDLILIAVLNGGDYDKVGLPGCGLKIAYGISRDLHLAYDLCRSAIRCDRPTVHIVLAEWRERLRAYLRSDPDHHLGRQYVALADAMPDSFPDLDVLNAYVKPVTTGRHNTHHLPKLEVGQASVAALARLCERYFSWGTAAGITKKFAKTVWPGIVLRLLMSEHVSNLDGAVECAASNALHSIEPGRTRFNAGILERKIKFSLTALRTETISLLISDRDRDPDGHDLFAMAASTLTTWVPACLVPELSPSGASVTIINLTSDNGGGGNGNNDNDNGGGGGGSDDNENGSATDMHAANARMQSTIIDLTGTSDGYVHTSGSRDCRSGGPSVKVINLTGHSGSGMHGHSRSSEIIDLTDD